MLKNVWKNEKIYLVIILLIAGITRLYDIGILPNGLHQDESFVALNAYDLISEGRDSGGHIWPVYMSSWGDGQSAMYIWLLLPFMYLSKNSLNLVLIRMPQVIISLFTILTIYGIGKELWNSSKKGLLAAALLAICPWHFMMSRWALDANMAPGFVCFALYYFIKGTKNSKFLPISALFYGLTLYCYALTWLVVPVLLFLQIAYCLFIRKIKFGRTFLLSCIIVFITGLPIFLYFLINQGLIGEISLPFMTIYKSTGYRGAELASSFNEMVTNGKRLIRLLVHADTGAIWNSISPWGLFYSIGQLFIAFGSIALIINFVKNISKKITVFPEVLLMIQLIAGILLGILVTPQYHQTNLLFIPLVLLQSYGIWNTLLFMKWILSLIGNNTKDNLRNNAYKIVSLLLFLCYGTYFILFIRDYFGKYRPLVNAYFAEGVGESIEYAMQACKERGINKLTVEKGAQWPRVLLYSKTTPTQYFTEHLVYDVVPAPWSYQKEDIQIQTRINYDDISQDSIYILYYTDYDLFASDFDMISFADWYVAIPNN